jgi:hypothetical protein
MNAEWRERTEPPTPTFSPKITQFVIRYLSMFVGVWNRSTFRAISRLWTRAALDSSGSRRRAPSPPAERASLIRWTKPDSGRWGSQHGVEPPAAAGVTTAGTLRRPTSTPAIIRRAVIILCIDPFVAGSPRGADSGTLDEVRNRANPPNGAKWTPLRGRSGRVRGPRNSTWTFCTEVDSSNTPRYRQRRPTADVRAMRDQRSGGCTPRTEAWRPRADRSQI